MFRKSIGTLTIYAGQGIKMKRILGIDPGLIHTGWAVIECRGNERIYIASGVINPPVKETLPNRLTFIFKEVGKLVDMFATPSAPPNQINFECGIEITFVNKNPMTSLVLGHARGAAILAVSSRNIPIYEYEPNKVKKAISAAGHADKDQIVRMVKILLPKANPKTADESDALAIALCHANINRF